MLLKLKKYVAQSSLFIISLVVAFTSMAETTLVHNATIYTVNKDQPKVEAFVYQEDTIVATGKLSELEQQFPKAKKLDLNGKTVVPGFIDAHGHVHSLGRALMVADLVGTSSKQEIIQRLKDFAKDLPKDSWLTGRGWDQNDWPEKKLPSAADLDSAFPNRPVWLTRIDGHAAWGNSAALRQADKDLSGDWQIDGGDILRDENGNATGVFIDNAMVVIAEKIPAVTEAQRREALIRAMQLTASVGLTSAHDAGTDFDTWKTMNQLNAEKKLNLRLYIMADGDGALLKHLCETGIVVDKDAMLTTRALKISSDGALGSRGAAMLKPYSDKTDTRGLLLYKPKELTALAVKGAACGLQVNIHAIGDRGNRVTLDALEAASKQSKSPGRHRVEHAQIVSPEDFERFKTLNLIASVQPTHATSDMYWAEDRVGPVRIKTAYAWQTLLHGGIPLALGSDFPVEHPAPLPGFYAAVTRQDNKGWPEKGWYPDQKLSREQALYGFTLGAAYSGFQEDSLGSIETGKKADFVVLSKDIMQVSEIEILDTQILHTYIGGKAVYSKQ